jgi:hypothetical protein
MNDQYTNRDIADFKDVEPQYYLSNRSTGQDQPTILNNDVVTLNNKYSLNSDNDDIENIPNLKEILHKSIDLKANITFYTSLEDEPLYFGHLLKDTVLEYEAYTDADCTHVLRGNPLTIMGSPRPIPNEYEIHGFPDELTINQYLSFINEPENLNKIVTKEVTGEGNTYSIETDTD